MRRFRSRIAYRLESNAEIAPNTLRMPQTGVFEGLCFAFPYPEPPLLVYQDVVAHYPANGVGIALRHQKFAELLHGCLQRF